MIAPLFLTALAAVAAVAAPQDSAADLTRDLFAWRADILTQSDGPDALDHLRVLGARAEGLLRANPSRDEARDLVTELVSEELAWLQRAQNGRALAERTLELVEAVVAVGDTPASTARAGALRAALTPELVRAALGPAIERMDAAEPGRGAAGDAVVAAAVTDALERGDTQLLLQLGAAAVPHLVAASKAIDGRPLGAGQGGPLVALLEIDTAKGLEVALELAQSGDLLIKARVASALSETNLLGDDRTWEAPARGPKTSAWCAAVVATLGEDPAPVGRAAMEPLVGPFLERGEIGESIKGAALEWLRENRFEVRPVPEGVIELARELVSSRRPAVARRAAELLHEVGAFDALRAEAGRRRDMSLRDLIARSFTSRGAAPGAAVLDKHYRSRLSTFMPLEFIDEGAATALSGALEAARSQGKRAVDTTKLAAWIPWLKADQHRVFQDLMGHAGQVDIADFPAVRDAALGWMDNVSESEGPLAIEQHLSLFEAAVRAGGAASLCESFDIAAKRAAAGTAPEIAFARTLTRELLGPDGRMDDTDAERAFGWMDELAGPEGWRELIEESRSTSGYVVYRPFLRHLPMELQLQMIRALERTGYDALRSLDDDDLRMPRDGWLELVRDGGLGCEARKWAVAEFAGARGPASTRLNPEEVIQTIAECAATCGEIPIAARDLAQAGVDPQMLIGALMDREGTDDGLLLDTYVPLEDRALVERILERFPPVTWTQHGSSPLLAATATYIVNTKDPAWNGVLRQAWAAGGTVRKSLMDQIGYVRSPTHRELSALLLQEPGLRNTGTRQAAMDYVASFRDARALDALIEAARTTRNDKHRAELEAEIDGLLAWLDTEARWRAGRSGQERRVRAIAELVAIIEDGKASDDARAAAIRSLAPLGAVEEAPRLVRLLDKGPKALRSAAKDCLERMR